MFVLCWLKVSSSFAEAASRKKEGEVTFDMKLSDLEQHLKTAEKKLLQSQVSQHTEATEHGIEETRLSSNWHRIRIHRQRSVEFLRSVANFRSDRLR